MLVSSFLPALWPLLWLFAEVGKVLYLLSHKLCRFCVFACKLGLQAPLETTPLVEYCRTDLYEAGICIPSTLYLPGPNPNDPHHVRDERLRWQHFRQSIIANMYSIYI